MALERWEVEKSIEMYKSGVSMAEVARRFNMTPASMRRILIREGVHDANPQKNKVFNNRPKDLDVISISDIERVRSKVKVGDRMAVRTVKGESTIGQSAKSAQFLYAVRVAEVINTSNPKFCVVRFDSGVEEAVMWTDIVIAERRHAKYVG